MLLFLPGPQLIEAIRGDGEYAGRYGRRRGIDFRPPVGDDLGWDADDEVCLSVGIGAGSEMIGWSRIRSAERRPFERGSEVVSG